MIFFIAELCTFQLQYYVFLFCTKHEGTINRSTHLLKEDGKFRFLTPIEAELIQDFPANWTKYKKNKDTGEISEVSTRMRYFFMGNALVTGVVKRIGIELGKI